MRTSWLFSKTLARPPSVSRTHEAFACDRSRVSTLAMAPPKRDSQEAPQGMRAISSFFAPKTNIVSSAPHARSSPRKEEPAKALKTTARDAPGANARKVSEEAPRVSNTQASPAAKSPVPPLTASAKKSTGFRDPRRRSDSGAASPKDAKKARAVVQAEQGVGVSANPEDDIGRRIAVWWPSEKKYYVARVAAVDAHRGKHHLKYDDGDDEWISISKRKTAWDAEADDIAAENFQDDDLVSEKSEDDDDDDDDDESDDDESDEDETKSTRRHRLVARKNVAAAAANVSGRRPARAAKRRAVVLSDSDEDFDVADVKDDERESESEFEVDSEDEEEDEEDEEDEASESEDDAASKQKRGAVGLKKGKTTSTSSKKTITASSPNAKLAERPRLVIPAALPVVRGAPGGGSATSFVNRMASEDEKSKRLSGSAEGAVDLASGLAGPARYADREARLFPWLHVSRRRDTQGRRPSDPGYDPSTLQLPSGFPKCVDSEKKPFAVSPGQAQWWRFKAQHFDSVILFKMGKFYEMFEMDAHVGASDLGLAYMKGEQPHCGFPEKNYSANAERLARAGHRVVVVEQVETPAQLAERKAAGQTKDSVVRREKVGILTKGTLVDIAMCEASPDAAYVAAVIETPSGSNAGDASGGDAEASESPWIGVCAVDCATGRFLVGAWRDDSNVNGLRAALTALRPVELVTPPDGFSASVAAAARAVVPAAAVRRRRGDARVSTAAGALELFAKGEYFAGAFPRTKGATGGGAPSVSEKGLVKKANEEKYGRLPATLASLESDPHPEKRDAGLGAFAAMTQYLKDAMLDADLVPLGRVEMLPGPEDASRWAFGGFVHLDAAALSGLEILEDSGGGAAGSLLHVLDRCASAGGRRVLRRWITRPLRSPAAIRARQVAIADLRTVGLDAMGAARAALRKAPDLERAVSRLVGAAGGRGRDAANVVLYEDAARERLRAFLSCLEGIQAAVDATNAFDEVKERLRSPALLGLVAPSGDAVGARDFDLEANETNERPTVSTADLAAVDGASMPSLDETLGRFRRAFDWDAAKRSGRIAPQRGADPATDAADARLESADSRLQSWLRDARATLGGGADSGISLVSVNKDTHVLEIPDRFVSKIPGSWSREGTRKGFERFDSPDLAELRKERADAEEAREDALGNVLRTFIRTFCEEWPRWRAAAEAVSTLDALTSLAVAAEELAASGAETCTPSVLEATPGRAPFLRAEKVRHPCLTSLVSGNAFVPNDVRLGGVSGAFEEGGDAGATDSPILLLTGPNMGGKSTLLRQICLCAVMAHVGADVPAKRFEMSAADAVYVRMGARDDVAGGRSTFMVELSETAAMLRRCTNHSLVALDELGRGTSTSDGFAIASAVMNKLLRVGARTLFATHYHRLAEEHERVGTKTTPEASDKERNSGAGSLVALAHMGCDVRPADADGDADGDPAAAAANARVTFLYTLEKGSCPKSHGVNVARLAGLPESVLRAASKRSAALEAISIAKRRRAETDRTESVLARVLRAADSKDASGLVTSWNDAMSFRDAPR